MTTLAILALLGGIVGGLGQTLSGIQAERQARQDARTLRARGLAEAQQRRREARRLIARQRVAFAAAGVDPASGGPLDLLRTTAQQEELAALLTAHPFLAEAESLKFRGREQRNAAVFAGISTMLGGAGQALQFNTQPSTQASSGAFGRSNSASTTSFDRRYGNIA